MSEEIKNVPAEVPIPSPNFISSRYKIIPGPISSNPGGGRHHYFIEAVNDAGEMDFSTEIHFQEGPLNDGPHNGLLSIVLLALLKDHFESYQQAEFRDVYTQMAIAGLDGVIANVVARANDRAVRGVLGKHEK
jgi:hypothetical protein